MPLMPQDLTAPVTPVLVNYRCPTTTGQPLRCGEVQDWFTFHGQHLGIGSGPALGLPGFRIDCGVNQLYKRDGQSLSFPL
jgi:hypothetical protein